MNGTDDRKVSKWAKVLSDAGLLDDVDDSWELPAGTVASGSTITVTPGHEAAHEESFFELSEDPHERITKESLPAPGVQWEDEGERVTLEVPTLPPADARTTAPPPPQEDERLTVEPTFRRGEDTTRRVSYSEKHGPNPDVEQRRMPLSTVRRSEEPVRRSRLPIPPQPKDTDPAPLARYSMSGAPSDDMQQPRFVASKISVPPDDRDGEDGNDHIPTGRQRPLSEPLSTERVVRVGTSKIAVAAWEGTPDGNTGSIVDEPIRGVESVMPRKPDLRGDMAKKYDVGDFSGALAVADEILSLEPDSLDALQYRKSCRERLLKMYEARIGDMSVVPRVRVSNHELMWRNLDAASGFVLSRVDGLSTYDNILDISGLPRFETCRILHQLINDGLIG
jgi:hypothetical protein